MANETNKTQEILEFKVEQGAAITDMEKLRKTMIGLKEEQTQLSKAYKQGDITVEEYAKEITRVDTLLKKVSTSHLQQQKAMAGVQTETSKLIKSNQQLTQSLKDSAGQINVAGVNVGQLSQRITALANPVTASIALVGALGAAYARSTIGAKDLAFAQSQLSAAVTIVTNDFARLISSAEDGEGAVTKILNNVLSSFGPAGVALSLQSGGVAMAMEALEDLAREELKIRAEISDRLADNQETLTLINDEQTKLQDKLIGVSNIIGNLRTNATELLAVKEKELTAVIQQLASDQENEKLQTTKLGIEKEIAKIKADTEKKVQAILRLEENIKTQEQKKLEIQRLQTSELERQARIATLERQLAGNKSPLEELRDDTNQRVKIATDASRAMGKAAESLADQVEAANKRQKKSNEGLADSTDAQRDALRLFSSEAARLYQTIDKENKVFAAAQLAVDAALTLSGITKHVAQLGPIAGPIYAAAAGLSAATNLTRAAKLLGQGSSGFDYAGYKDFSGQILTASDGQRYAIGQKGEVIPVDSNSDIVTNRRGDIFESSERSSRGLLYRLTHPFRALRRAFGRKSSYASGGWTGPGDMYDVAGVVHADEYVAPKKVVNNPAAQPHLKALERLRGSYATGGYTGFSSTQNNISDIVRMISSIKIFASITDINKAEKRQAVKMGIVTK